MEKITVVVPTYNEKENISELISKIFSQPIPGLELIFIDDGSPDGTARIIKEQAQKYPIQILERPRLSGLGSAYRLGFKLALQNGADFVLQMDADLSHNPDDLPKLLGACRAGADLAIGSRKIEGGQIIGWSYRRKLMSNGAMWFSRFLLGLKTKDVTSGFRCFKRASLEKINPETIQSNGYAFQEEIVYRAEKLGLKIAEVPIVFVDRRHGRSKLNKKTILEFFWIIFKLKWQNKKNPA